MAAIDLLCVNLEPRKSRQQHQIDMHLMIYILAFKHLSHDYKSM